MTPIEEIHSEDLFEAISHPLRIRILKALVKRPMRFADLKRRFEIKSSGELDFHLKKLGNLVSTNRKGCYRVTIQGGEALKAIKMVQRSGSLQLNMYYTILAAILIIGIYLFSTNNLPMLFLFFLGTVVWMSYLPH